MERKAMPRRPISIEDLRKVAILENSYTRLPRLLQLNLRSRPSDWWTVLGEEWSGFDNIGQYCARLRHLFERDKSHVELMMSADEREALRSLPHLVTVYRGCYEFNKNGLSWTLSRSIANSFPFLHRYRHESVPLLLMGQVPRDSVVLKLDRDEQELICPKVEVVQIDELQPWQHQRPQLA